MQETAPQASLPTRSIPVERQGYRDLLRRVRVVVHTSLAADATILVVSRGDPALLELQGRRGWHFPQEADGRYAGYHPANSAAAISHLEELRSKGAEYILLPSTAFWWL